MIEVVRKTSSKDIFSSTAAIKEVYAHLFNAGMHKVALASLEKKRDE
jgi:hypothetical protein